YRIKLDGFGSFKVGLKTRPAETAREFTAAKHVVGSRINFQPETHWTSASGGVRNRVFLDGITCEETPENAVE
nr:DNA-binding protein [Prevotella sp.]